MPDEENKPTAAQVAWVFEKLVEHYSAGGTFQALIKRMGFTKADYPLLYQSGGQLVSNLIAAAHAHRQQMERIAEQVFGKKET